MSKFDEAKFRSAAKAAGYSDEEINAELGTPTGSAPPVGMAAVPAIEKEFKDEYDAKKATLKKDYEEEKKEITTTSPFTIPGILSSPVVTGAGLLALGYGAGKYGPQAFEKAKGAYKSVKERLMASPVQTPVRIDPIGFESFADMTPTPTTAPLAPGPIARTPLPTGAVNLDLFSSSPKAPVPPGQPPMTPFTPDELAAVFRGESVSTPITSAPVDAPAPTPSAQPNSPVTSIVTDTVKEMIQETPAQPVEAVKPVAAAPAPVAPPQELRTGTGKPAFAGMGPEAALNKKGEPKFKPEYADINAVPRGFAFVPGADKIDTLRNTLGQQAYTEAYKNRPFPSTNEMAMQQASEINRMLGRPTRPELIAAGLPPAANTPGITQLTNPPKGSGMGTKTAKVGGVLGALVAIPDLAKAQTANERAMAATNLLEAILPPGFMMGGAGEGSGVVPSVDAAMLLGSPYAQSEFAKKRRQEQEYVRKVGAGRGIAPPSAYQR